MKLDEIIKTKREILDGGYDIENNIIGGCNVVVTGHFGNVVSLNLWCMGVSPFSGYNNTDNIGFLIKSLIEFFELTDEDGFNLSEDFRNIPCRIILEKRNRCVGFGHFMKDKFVFSKDFAKIME